MLVGCSSLPAHTLCAMCIYGGGYLVICIWWWTAWCVRRCIYCAYKHVPIHKYAPPPNIHNTHAFLLQSVISIYTHKTLSRVYTHPPWCQLQQQVWTGWLVLLLPWCCLSGLDQCDWATCNHTDTHSLSMYARVYIITNMQAHGDSSSTGYKSSNKRDLHTHIRICVHVLVIPHLRVDTVQVAKYHSNVYSAICKIP